MPTLGQDVMAWLTTLDGVSVETLPMEQVRTLHTQWLQITVHPEWARFPTALRAEYLVQATQVALVVGDIPAAQRAWQAAVAARPDTYGLRVTLREVMAIDPRTAPAERVALVVRIRDAMQRTPVARPDAQGVYRRLDRI